MNDRATNPQLTTHDINRRDLMRMSKLSGYLAAHDVIYVNNRGELDAVMVRADKILAILDDGGAQALASVIRDRLRQDTLPTLTDRDISILNAIGELGNARLVDIAVAVKRESSNIHRALQEMVDCEMVDRSMGNDITYSLTGLGRRTIES